MLAVLLAGCGGDNEGAAGGGGAGGGDAASRDVAQEAPRADVGTNDGTSASADGDGASATSDGTSTMDSVAVGDAGDAGAADRDASGAGDAGDAAGQVDARADAPRDASRADVSVGDANTADARDAGAANDGSADAETPEDAGATDEPMPDAETDASSTDAAVEACVPITASVTRTPTSAVSAFSTDVDWAFLSFLTDNIPSSYANTVAPLTATATRTRPLILTGYGFDIPTNAAVTGVAVEIWRGSPNSATAGIQDGLVRLQSGASTSLSRAKLDKWPGVLFSTTYGGQYDVWGVPWIPSMINASSFGVYMYAQRYGTNDDTPRVGQVAITVHYTISCP